MANTNSLTKQQLDLRQRNLHNAMQLSKIPLLSFRYNQLLKFTFEQQLSVSQIESNMADLQSGFALTAVQQKQLQGWLGDAFSHYHYEVNTLYDKKGRNFLKVINFADDFVIVADGGELILHDDLLQYQQQRISKDIDATLQDFFLMAISNNHLPFMLLDNILSMICSKQDVKDHFDLIYTEFLDLRLLVQSGLRMS